VPDPERVAITLPVEDGLAAADYVGLAELAERCGYDAGAAPGDVAGSRATITGLAEALGLPA
jgi:hypothetical protein